MNRRSLRLETVAGLGMALAAAILPAVAAASQNVATETTLNLSTSDRGGHTQAAVTVSVTDEYGLPASGAVSIEDGDRVLTEVALDSAGQASTAVTLPGGAHALQAVYTGDDTHLSSASQINDVQATVTTTPGFQVSVSPISPSSFPMVLPQGGSGTAEVTVTPQNSAALTAPMFVTLSCSGLPNQASCTFTPASIEILPSATGCATGSTCPPISSMLLQTNSGGTTGRASLGNGPTRKGSPIAWAFLLPGVLGLGGFAWKTRRRAWLSRLTLVVLVGLVATMGATGCSPLYRYYQHGPGDNPPTPAGTYNVTITAQSSNGVTSTTSSTTMVLTVQ